VAFTCNPSNTRGRDQKDHRSKLAQANTSQDAISKIANTKNIAALFTIAKLWKQPRCPTANEWIKKMWCLYTIEFYSTIKKNETLSFAGKWMELKNNILSEVSQVQKAKGYMFFSYVEYRPNIHARNIMKNRSC
jgi:hypothetical protein